MAESSRAEDSALSRQFAREIEGEVLFDRFSRGRYSTDASIYQIDPIGIVVPKTNEDLTKIIGIASREGVPVLPRGGGTSQCGQTVGDAVVVDVSKYLNDVVSFDPQTQSVCVQPGIVLDKLNAFLRPHGLWFPVDVSTSSRATLGGMAGNNSCGTRSLKYGTMRDNVLAVDAMLADGSEMYLGELSASSGAAETGLTGAQSALINDLVSLGAREAEEISNRFPKLMRRVGGYNIDALVPGTAPTNLSHLMVGSEGTLAFFKQLTLKLSVLPRHKTLGICHFPTLREAMQSTPDIVALEPVAVELVDRTMLDLARQRPIFRDTVDSFVKGNPGALLLVEFAGEDRETQHRKLRQLEELMNDLGFENALVKAPDAEFQKAVWEVRKAALNIMMSMQGDGKPISFIEDCAVDLADLASYTDELTEIFRKHETVGTWYAHASVGCLHVRPVLNLKQQVDVKKLRAIAEEAFALVRSYKGSHSGEHGDGIVRSEFHEDMFGSRMVRNFEEVKGIFDPGTLFNPGKIVNPPRMDDQTLFRYKPAYDMPALDTTLDWSEWRGFGGAVEMCNNNGACRKRDAQVMCPSFRATGDEKDLTRGRANTLRLALSGQLGPDAFTSDDMYDTMSLCVGCKGCKRECPTGVDMARMKIEFLYHYSKRHGISLRDSLVAYLPRYAPLVSRVPALANLRDAIPGLAWLSEKLIGLSSRRSMPRWHAKPFRADEIPRKPLTRDGKDVVLWVDTFNTYLEPENARAAKSVLEAAGYRVHFPVPADKGRPICCGRTFLASGLVDEARVEAVRLMDTLKPFIDKGIPIVGLEPSCLYTLHDEFKAMLPGDQSDALALDAFMFEDFLARELDAGRLKLPLRRGDVRKVLLHGHCHQKAFDGMGAVQKILGLIPDLEVECVVSSCCGMAGAFGYNEENYDISMAMGEASLFPAVRAVDSHTAIVTDGLSCRHQIMDGTGRAAQHVAVLLEAALQD